MEDRNHRVTGQPLVDRRAPSTTSPGIKPAVQKGAVKPTGRHAAIRNTLPTLATYKTWSAKARTDWQE